jgi:hypothetical protein
VGQLLLLLIVYRRKSPLESRCMFEHKGVHDEQAGNLAYGKLERISEVREFPFLLLSMFPAHDRDPCGRS